MGLPLSKESEWSPGCRRLFYSRKHPEMCASERTVEMKHPMQQQTWKPQLQTSTASQQEVMVEIGVGAQLGKYLLTEEIGQGGTGIVYQALHQALQIPVAVKFIRPDVLLHEPELYDQLRSEARLLAQLNHPNLVRVWDFEDNFQCPYLVLEYVGGSTLLDLIQGSGGVRLEQALRITIQIADGLAVSLKHGIIHRDVKPANILLTRDGVAKLTDMGQAAVRTAARLNGENDIAPSGGTPAYMAPEQFLTPGIADHRADIYSLGCSLYQMLTGHIPFEANSLSQMMMMHNRERPTTLHLLESEMPEGVVRVVLRMLEKDPEDRYQTYADLTRDLRACLHVDTTTLPSWQKQRERFHSTDSPSKSHTGTNCEIRFPPQTDSDKSKTKQESTDCRVAQAIKVGMIALKTGKTELACQMLREATQIDPDNELAWVMLARVVPNPNESQTAYQKALSINPDNVLAKNGLRKLSG